MTKRNQLAPSVGTLVGVVLLSFFVTAYSALPVYDSLFQSELPTPSGRSAVNPNAIRSESGGRVYCGSEQSSSWIDIPAGFTSEWGAEFYCSAAVTLKNWGNQTGMWDDQGFLIGIYPATVPLVKPVRWVHEIDPVRVKSPCNQCLVGRYYQPAGKTWLDLPTVYEASLGRVMVEIGANRPSSGYPGYTDQVLVALFQISQPATAQVQATSMPASTAASAAPTSQPTSAVMPIRSSPTPVPTMKRATPSPMVIGTVREPAPSLTMASEINPTNPSATSIPASPTTRNLTTTSTPAFAGSTASGPPSKVTFILLGVIGLLSVAVIAMLIVLIKKKPR